MSAQNPIVVIARWRTAGDQLGVVVRLASELRTSTLEEPGCIGYELYQHIADGEVLVLEHYVDTAASEEHRKSTHYQELLVKQILPRLDDRKVDILQPVTPG